MKLAGTVGTGGVDPFYPAFFQPVFQLFPVCRIFFRKQEKRGLAAAAGCQPDLWLRPSKDLQRFFQYGCRFKRAQPGQKTAGVSGTDIMGEKKEMA